MSFYVGKMIDIKYILENVEEVKKVCRLRGVELDVDFLLKNYNELRKIKGELDNLKREKNKLTERVNELKKKGEDVMESIVEELKDKNRLIKQLEGDYKELKEKHDNLMYRVPNLLDERVPLGDKDREEFRGGKFPKLDFKGKTNWEIFEDLGLADFKTGIKIAGERGWLLKGNAARLQKAILAFATDFWRRKGYFEIIPPYFVNEENLYITGHYPNGKDEVYKTEDGKVFVGTGEISILGMYANQLIHKRDLPIKIMAHTPCFRREAGTNKDDKGLYRTHQFDKLELIHICTKEQAEELYKELFEDLKEFYEKLELPYRMITLRADDMAVKALIERDMELWFEAEKRWGEVGSYGITGEFQARRGNIKWEGEGIRDFVNTTYVTGCVPNRILIAILNNYQEKDGTVRIPKALVPYMDGIEKLN